MKYSIFYTQHFMATSQFICLNQINVLIIMNGLSNDILSGFAQADAMLNWQYLASK